MLAIRRMLAIRQMLISARAVVKQTALEDSLAAHTSIILTNGNHTNYHRSNHPRAHS